MTRSDAQIALNDVVETCEDVAAAHDDAAKRATGSLARTLREIAERRRERGRSLALDVRGLGELPRDADTDAQSLKQLVSRVKGALAPDEIRVLAKECLDREAELAARAGRALVQDLPDEVLHHLTCLMRDLREDAARLREAVASAGRAPGASA